MSRSTRPPSSDQSNAPCGATFGPKLIAVRGLRPFSAETGQIKRLVRDEGVAGSNPATPTNQINALPRWDSRIISYGDRNPLPR